MSKGRPKGSGNKNKSGLLSLHCPSSGGSAKVMIKMPMSKDNNLAIGGQDGLKQGTWKRVQNRPQVTSDLALTNVIGPKRSSKENSREAEKAKLAKKKTKVSNNEGLHVFSSVDRIISVEVAMQPR